MNTENMFITFKSWEDMKEDEKDTIRKIRGRGKWEHGVKGQHMKCVSAVCPDCGEVFPYKFWEAIEVSSNPNLYSEIIKGNVWEGHCNKCEHTFRLDHDFLFYDLEKKIAIQYCSKAEDVVKVNQHLSSEMTNRFIPNMNEQGYVFRVVPTPTAMIDRIMVLDRGLDDRIVEIMKWGEIGVYFQNNPESMKRGDRIMKFFMRRNKEDMFLVYVNGNLVQQQKFDMGLYEYVYGKFHDKLPELNEDFPLILFEDLCTRLGD